MKHRIRALALAGMALIAAPLAVTNPGGAAGDPSASSSWGLSAQSLDGTGTVAAGLLMRPLDGVTPVVMIAAHPDD